jgi:hypothetical protein
MSNNKEIFKALKQFNEALNASINEAENSENISFFKESIKQAAINLYSQAQLINVSPNVKTPVEIKIIKVETNVEDSIAVPEPPKALPISIQEPIVEKVASVINIPVAKNVEKATEIIKEEIPKIAPPVIEKEVPPVAQKTANNNQAPSIVKQEEIDLDEATVNGKIAKYKQPTINLADKLKDTPIQELVKAISISKKFEFINELFKGNADAYKACISSIELAGSFEAAANFIESNIADTYAWDDNENLAAEFFLLVKRRYL